MDKVKASDSSKNISFMEKLISDKHATPPNFFIIFITFFIFFILVFVSGILYLYLKLRNIYSHLLNNSQNFEKDSNKSNNDNTNVEQNNMENEARVLNENENNSTTNENIELNTFERFPTQQTHPKKQIATRFSKEMSTIQEEFDGASHISEPLDDPLELSNQLHEFDKVFFRTGAIPKPGFGGASFQKEFDSEFFDPPEPIANDPPEPMFILPDSSILPVPTVQTNNSPKLRKKGFKIFKK